MSPVPFGSTGAQRFTSAPAVGVAGSTYYNTTTSILYVSDGSSWVPIATGGMGVATSDEGIPLQGAAIQSYNFVGAGIAATLTGPNAGTITAHDGPFLAPVRLVTTGNHSLSGLAAIDGVTPSAGDRIGAFYQSTGSQNGVYIAASGSWSRASDVNTSVSMAKGTRVWSTEGTLNAWKEWQQINAFATLGTDTAQWRMHVVVDTPNALSYPTPLGAGHMVWDTSNQVLRGWDGGSWKTLNGSITCTSSTRPSAPVDGMIIYETDTGLTYVRSAGGWVKIGNVPDPLIVNEIRTKKIDYNPAGSGDILLGASINANNMTIYGVPTPANSDWVATKAYVDSKFASAIPAPTRQIFTASGTWTKPAGAIYVEVEVIGGGGAGGGSAVAASGSHSSGAGGASGGYSKSTLLASGLGATETVTVGSAGAGVSGAAGANGTPSSFGSWVSAVGGNGGLIITGSTAVGVAGGGIGTGTTAGDITMLPEPGENAWGNAGFSNGGNGGSTPYGSGGRGGTTTGTGASAGSAGTGYGAGGGGSVNNNQAGSAAAGGAGAAGIVVVTTYYGTGGGGGSTMAYAVSAGTIDIVAPGGTQNPSINVTFPAGRFTVAPIVVANLVTATLNILTNVSAITSTGFTITLFHKTASTNVPAATYTIHWQAEQMTSGSAAG